jgi:hypothetical protein
MTERGPPTRTVDRTRISIALPVVHRTWTEGRMSWHPLAATGDDFLREAPLRYVNLVAVGAPPESLWAALTADDTLVSWSAVVTGLRWTTTRPYGVGTTREVTILRFVTVR